jgi:hypothetical protein
MISRILNTALVLIVLGAGIDVASAATTGLVNVSSNRVLSDNHYGKFRITANNVTLDCNGYQIDFHPNVASTCGDGNDSCGIEVNGRSNVTIKNCGLVGVLDIGVWVTNSSNTQVLNSYSYATTGYLIEDSTDTYLYQADARYNMGGHEYRDTSWLTAEDCWAFDAVGDGFDDNRGFEDTLIALWSRDNGVNGFECDDCQAPWYNVLAENNGQHGISMDGSPQFWVNYSSFLGNSEDGIRVQTSSNGAVTDSEATSSGDCDLRETGSSGNTWSNNIYGSRCGTVPAH